MDFQLRRPLPFGLGRRALLLEDDALDGADAESSDDDDDDEATTRALVEWKDRDAAWAIFCLYRRFKQLCMTAVGMGTTRRALLSVTEARDRRRKEGKEGRIEGGRKERKECNAKGRNAVETTA